MKLEYEQIYYKKIYVAIENFLKLKQILSILYQKLKKIIRNMMELFEEMKKFEIFVEFTENIFVIGDFLLNLNLFLIIKIVYFMSSLQLICVNLF
jgi:hypothetical protein